MFFRPCSSVVIHFINKILWTCNAIKMIVSFLTWTKTVLFIVPIWTGECICNRDSINDNHARFGSPLFVFFNVITFSDIEENIFIVTPVPYSYWIAVFSIVFRMIKKLENPRQMHTANGTTYMRVHLYAYSIVGQCGPGKRIELVDRSRADFMISPLWIRVHCVYTENAFCTTSMYSMSCVGWKCVFAPLSQIKSSGIALRFIRLLYVHILTTGYQLIPLSRARFLLRRDVYRPPLRCTNPFVVTAIYYRPQRPGFGWKITVLPYVDGFMYVTNGGVNMLEITKNQTSRYTPGPRCMCINAYVMWLSADFGKPEYSGHWIS